MSHLANIDTDYASWIEELSQRYKLSQIKAATHVNSEMLLFYWSLGKDIVTLRAESRWGDKFIASLSADLRGKLPGVKGLSETSIGYAKRFYLIYNEYFTIRSQVGVNYKIMQFGAFLGDIINTLLTSSSTSRKGLCFMYRRHWRTVGAGMCC